MIDRRFRFRRALWPAIALLLSLPVAAQEDFPVIEDGKQVAFNYALSIDGEVIESSEGREPLTYTQGGGQILPALETQLAGLKAGDEKSVDLAAADAYGEVNEEAFEEVEIDKIPEDARFEGAVLQSPGYQGTIRVKEIRDDVIVLDFNHPLAGKDLTFDVSILSVTDAPPPPTD